MKEYELASRGQILRFGRGCQVYTESFTRYDRRRAEIKELVTSECSMLMSFAWLASPRSYGANDSERWSYREPAPDNHCIYLRYKDLIVVDDLVDSITYANTEEGLYVVLVSPGSPLWLPPHLVLNRNPQRLH